jgi:SAM-dependent methyltransferase
MSTIFEYLGEKTEVGVGKKWPLAVDVGCGSGQCTTFLGPHFERVYGYDVSEAQIGEAIKSNQQPNIEYKTSPAESLPLSDGSVSLLTCSQAFHWLDSERFFTEAKRVLAPNGVLAIIGYCMPFAALEGQTQEVPGLKEAIRRTYKSPLLARHWNQTERLAVDSKYGDTVLPLSDFRRKEGIFNHVQANAEEVLGYIQSWSGYQKALKNEPSAAQQVLKDYEMDIETVTGIKGLSNISLKLSYEFFILLGRK